MYLSKPEKGFCISVLYVNKKDLNIDELKEISSLDKKADLNLEVNICDYEKSKIEEENLAKAMRSGYDKLIFDEDEVEGIKETIEKLIDRRAKEIKSEDMGILILDDEAIEKNKITES